jgi:hypothetical protein
MLISLLPAGWRGSEVLAVVAEQADAGVITYPEGLAIRLRQQEPLYCPVFQLPPSTTARRLASELAWAYIQPRLLLCGLAGATNASPTDRRAGR